MASVHGVDESDTEMFVLDSTEAFFQIPLHPQERRFFTAMLLRNGIQQFLTFLRMVHGEQRSPSPLGAVGCAPHASYPVALRCRPPTPIVFCRHPHRIDRQHQAATHDLHGHHHPYAGSTLIPIRLPQRTAGVKVVWIGGALTITPTGVEGFIKQDIIDDIRSDLENFAKLNTLTKKDQHTRVGRVNFAAGLLTTLGPFLYAIWAALYSN